MKEVTVTLSEPIQWGSETIKELKIPTPKAKHIRGLKMSDGMSSDEMLTLLSRLTNMTDGQIDELSITDVLTVSEVLSDFLEDTPKTGNTPSA